MNAKYSAYAVAAMLGAASPAAAADIVETAVSNGSFKTLTAALQAAGLVETLKGKVPTRSLRPPTRPSRSSQPERSRPS